MFESRPERTAFRSSVTCNTAPFRVPTTAAHTKEGATSYLTQYAKPGAATLRPACPGARVDERLLLNFPAFDGGAHVRAFVEDTSAKRVRRRRLPSPRLRLRITDCSSQIRLEFSVDSPDLRDNSLHKIETLIASLERFRDGLRVEAELRAAREDGSRARKEKRCRT